MKRKSKKGAEFTISTLIVIILAIVLLVVIVLGFTAGWSNMWSRIVGFISPANVDTIKQSCDFACSTNAKYDWCEKTRSVTWQDAEGKKQPPISITCKAWAESSLTQFSTKPESCSN